MSCFFPTIYLSKVTDIDQSLLQKYDVKAILLDIDNTLSPHNAGGPFDGVEKWLDEMRCLNIKLLILSNRSNIQNVSDFAQKLNLNYVADAKKPFQMGFNKAVNILGLPCENVLLVGDQIFTDILGANLFGLKSALVEPQDKNESVFIKIKRFFEMPFRAAMRYNVGKRNVEK